MKLDINHLEESMFEIIDQVKVFISQDTWENILLNCTKNEMLILLLLYRQSTINMTQIADYLGVPLNTATGIVTRMEKKHMVNRLRSLEDKRVVTIELTESGQKQINQMMGNMMIYGRKIVDSLTAEELSVMGNIIDKVVRVMQEDVRTQQASTPKVRKITID